MITTSDLALEFHVSLRQLQWWDEQGLICPRHEHRRRIYSSEQALLVGVCAMMRNRNFPLQKIRRVIKRLGNLEDVIKKLGKRRIFLITGVDGKDATVLSDADLCLRFIASMNSPVVVVDITAVVDGRRA